MQDPSKIEHGPGGPPPEIGLPTQAPEPHVWTEEEVKQMAMEYDKVCKQRDVLQKKYTQIHTYLGAALSTIGHQLQVLQEMVVLLNYKGDDI